MLALPPHLSMRRAARALRGEIVPDFVAVGNSVIIANGALIAGHVTIADRVTGKANGLAGSEDR